MTEKGLTAADVKGTGKGGRITKEDVEAAAKAASLQQLQRLLQQLLHQQHQLQADTALGERSQKRVPMTRLRKTIANRLIRSEKLYSNVNYV